MTENSLQQSHEPQLLRQLRQKTLNLNMKIEKLTSQNKQKLQIKNNLEQQLNKLRQQNQIQIKKHRSLIVLLNQLQQNYHNQYLEQRQQQQMDEVTLSMQNSLLRFLLIRQTQSVKESQKLLNFLKHILLDKNKGKAKQFIKKSNFLQTQSEMIAKLRSQINLMRNDNLQCKRKWYQLQQQSKNLQSHNKLLSIQNQRQKIQIKTLYQEYLQRINQAKTKVVSYNQTQKQSTIHEYLVKQIAILQQKRVQIQQENSNLHFHFQNLKQEIQRIQVQNKELTGFFLQPGQQGSLAQKMRKRIQQLRDVLLECKKKSKNTRGGKLRKIMQNIRKNYNLLIQSNDYVQMKTKQQQKYGSLLQQKPIADFFSRIIDEKDQTLSIMRQQQGSLRQKLKQLQVQKQLLTNQISNLQQNLNIDGWQTKYAQSKNWGTFVAQRQPSQKQSKIVNKNQYNTWGEYGNFTFDSRNL